MSERPDDYVEPLPDDTEIPASEEEEEDEDDDFPSPP